MNEERQHTTMNIEKLKFPIGKYTPNKNPDTDLLNQWIAVIREFPTEVDNLTNGLSAEKLNWKYRPEGWTVKQVVHHCADSHMNCFIRFKLALTEDSPSIRPYYEDRWANLTDSQTDDLSDSLLLLNALHRKWVVILNSLTDEALKLTFVHPEHGMKFNLAETIGNYAWHCNHHLAHIKNGIASKGVYH